MFKKPDSDSAVGPYTERTNERLSSVSVIPQPVYMNAEELQRMASASAVSSSSPPSSGAVVESPDDDLKTPTVEELSFPGAKTVRQITKVLKKKFFF